MGIMSSVPAKKAEPTECTMVPERKQFEKEKVLQETALLKFKGIDGFVAYNCSVPFTINGKRHLYGRVERVTEWVNSYSRLFVETGKDEFTLVPHAMSYQLEDPFVVKIKGEMLFGGVHVIKNKDKVCDYFCDFYRGTPGDLRYFTAGPTKMKDIRLVELADGRIGIFSHHKTSTTCITGFITINSLDELSKEVIDAAVPIDHTLFGDAWGGVNQPYLLSTGKIGCISHHGYVDKDENGGIINVYCNTSFVYEPSTNKVYAYKILGTKNCYPECEPKIPRLCDCAFVSGITMRPDGKCDLYSGVGDVAEGRMVIDYPFEGHGEIVDNLDF
ncbi:hypothetical protein AGDE_05663 [Angomonas deanei]|uniref:Uncharacterized protein n=1 Tax=Angomonas deanei TaxID=59799 RepID=A0A7G2CS58_9TRYP|nr:hypothetical protein AGDE_05663 [Angomonas deanei]CAD2222580.1 Protein of unknown function (DUF1861), putative [Angomonas deanei]|eukprot:EPY38266.1 hypothetical protein AGDE_05663 [Angomonas deanei]